MEGRGKEWRGEWIKDRVTMISNGWFGGGGDVRREGCVEGRWGEERI